MLHNHVIDEELPENDFFINFLSRDIPAYSVASYTKGELFLVELGYIVGEETLSKIMNSKVSTQ